MLIGHCRSVSLSCLAVLLLSGTPCAAAEPSRPKVATMDGGSHGQVAWRPEDSTCALDLTVVGPSGQHVQRRFAPGVWPLFRILDDSGQPRSEGMYSFELTRVVAPTSKQQRRLESLLRTGNERAARALTDSWSATPVAKQSGHFWIRQGQLVLPGHAADSEDDGPSEDVSVLDDHIVFGSSCIGLDCVVDEVFDADTLRLKENNLRIGFHDTSTNLFPGNDWELRINDMVNGGADHFSVVDLGTGNSPLRVDAGAPEGALRVNGQGQLGLGTSAPIADLHLVRGNTPLCRLEQDASLGLPPQAWDLAGGQINFFLRDATAGSTPFRVQSGAPSNSLVVRGNGNVGIGTVLPEAKLHVAGTAAVIGQTFLLGDQGSLKLHLEEFEPSPATRQLLEMRNHGPVRVLFQDKTANLINAWQMGTSGTDFVLKNFAGGDTELRVASGGNVTISGTLSQLSDAHAKQDLEPVNPAQVLAQLLDLPVMTWSYKKGANEGSRPRHMGPMAQDFHSAYGLGADERHVSALDTSGVTMAAIQGLHALFERQQREIQELRQSRAAAEERMRLLEQRLADALTEAEGASE